MEEEQIAEGWRQLCKSARREHLAYLQTVRPIEHRPILQPDGLLYCVRGPEQWEPVPYTLESRAEVTAQVEGYVRQDQVWSMAMVVVGVAPEQQAGQLRFRPALLTTLTGCGSWEGKRFEIVQSLELEPTRVVAYGPITRMSSLHGIGDWIPDSLGDPSWPRECWRVSEDGSTLLRGQ